MFKILCVYTIIRERETWALRREVFQSIYVPDQRVSLVDTLMLCKMGNTQVASDYSCCCYFFLFFGKKISDGRFSFLLIGSEKCYFMDHTYLLLFFSYLFTETIL